MHTIKIFIASSEELHLERLEFTDMIQQLNRAFRPRGIELEPVKWEYLDASMGAERKQSEYNNALRECEVCLVMYWNRFGEYTEEELVTAYEGLKAGQNPRKLYVYFKEPASELSDELKDFKASFATQYGHFYCKFENVDTLKTNFLLQFLDYQSKSGESKGVVEVRNGKVLVGGTEYVALQNVPFAGNNEEYNLLQKSIRKTEKLMTVTDTGDPDYADYAKELLEMKEKLQKMEDSLWDTALKITELLNKKSSERLQRAMDLFMAGDNKGAQAVLNEEEIDRDVKRNLALLEKGKEGLKTNVEEYELKIKTLENEMGEGWLEKIVELRTKILDIYRELYDERHEMTAEAYNDLGLSCGELGDYQNELEYCMKSLGIREKVFGERHPNTATSYNNVGCAYGNLGDYQKELEYYQRAFEISKEILGDLHPETLTSYNNIGVAYGELGDYHKALKCKLKALELSNKILGERHPDTAISYDNVGGAYGELGDHQKELEYYLKALEIFKEIHGERHPDTVTSCNNVGYAYGELGYYQKALEYYHKALEISKGILGERHPDTVLSYNNVGYAYGELGDWGKALEYLSKALDINIEVLGEWHPDTATSYNNVGGACGELGDHQEELKYYQKALEIREKVLGARHPKTALSYNNVGYAYYKLGDLEKAEEFSGKAQEIREALENE